MTAEPALAHEVTAQLYALSVRRARARVFFAVFLPVLLGAVVWALAAAEVEAVRTFLLLALALVVWQGWTPPGIGHWTWRPAPRRLLTEQPWRETPAKVLNVRGTVLVLPDGYVQVHGLPAAARDVAVRTGRVWTVGPDAEGRLAVRVDGLYTPWPARRIPPRPGTAALPADEPTAAMAAHRADVLARRVLVGVLVVFSTLTVLSVVLAVLRGGSWQDLLQAAGYASVAVALVARLRHLERLRPREPWVRAEATAPSWRARRNGVADGTVTVTFPDGRQRTAQLDRAPLDLFANVVREKGLWVAGDRVAGFPGYAIVAAARFR